MTTAAPTTLTPTTLAPTTITTTLAPTTLAPTTIGTTLAPTTIAPPTSIYYSVSPFGTSDIKTGSPDITISSGVATLSVPQTGNIGQGDRITYDGGSIVYISAVNSSISFDVITATGGIPADAFVETVDSISHEFSSISSAISGMVNASHLNSIDLPTIDVRVYLVCYYDHDDDTPFSSFVISGILTDTVERLVIKSACGGVCSLINNRHEGVFTLSNKVRIENYATAHTAYLSVSGTTLEGFILYNTAIATYANAYLNPTKSNNVVRDCIIKGGAYGVVYSWISGNSDNMVYNNVIYDARLSGIHLAGVSGTSIYVFNNTIYNCNQGNASSYGGIRTNNTNAVIINNICYSNLRFDYNLVAAPSVTSTNNLSKDATAPAYGTFYINKTLTFAVTTPGLEDLHLVPADTDAIDKGTDLSAYFTDDVIGTARAGTWDVGAFEWYDNSVTISVSLIDITIELELNEITLGPEVWYYSFNPYLNTNIDLKDNPIEITLSVEGSQATVGIFTDVIEIIVTTVIDRVRIGQSISVDPINIYISILFNGSIDNVIGVELEDTGGKCNFVKWSKIGYVDFTIDESNIAGERPMDFSGCVYHIKKLGNKVIVYGENGVSALLPNGVVYGLQKIYPRGLKSRYSIAGDDDKHFFIDDLGCLYSLGETLTKYDYSEYLSSMTDPVMVYDQERQLIYIADNSLGYVFSITNPSIGEGPTNITGFGYKSGSTYVVGDGEIDIPTFEICTDIYDFDTRKPKTITSVEVGTDLTQHLFASIDYRVSYNDQFKQIGWFLVNPSGKSFPKCYGVEFRIRLKSLRYEYFDIDYLRIRGIIHGYSYLDSTL